MTGESKDVDPSGILIQVPDQHLPKINDAARTTQTPPPSNGKMYNSFYFQHACMNAFF